MDKDSVLDEIFANDPDGILNVKPKSSPAQNEDQRLVSSFEEINVFIDTYGKEPIRNMSDMHEMKLYSRLKGLREHDEKMKALQKYDRHKLLVREEEIEINSIDDIFSADNFGLLDDAEDIFTLKHIPKEREETDFVARRKTCKNFETYELLFKQCQAELKSGKRKLVKFNEKHLDDGTFFILKGLMGYLVKKKVQKGKFSKVDGRIFCVFENGTESNMLFRSLGKGLYEDGYLVSEHEDRTLDKLSPISEEDKATGFIYILKSKSEDDRIKLMKNLYKIGFSTVDVKERIKNAEKDPTYLMAPVALVSTFECYNMDPHKLEQLLHKFFGKSCLDIDIFDKNGDRYTPREWFVAPIDVIEQSIELIISGDIVHHRYDGESERIVEIV